MDLPTMAYEKCPLTALSRETKTKLSNALNNQKIIRSERGYERDWRGLAALTEQLSLCGDNAAINDAFERVLKLWCENKPETATFGNLVLYLSIIDRWHVIEEIEENLQKDFQAYQTLQQTAATTPTLSIQHDNTDTNIHQNNNDAPKQNAVSVNLPPENVAERLNDYDMEAKILTSNDVQSFQYGLPLQQYDAFVLYADKDYEYALEILHKLQDNPAFNFTFCLKDDLLFGIPFEHIALMELIRERCRFLIAILTKEFTQSPENRFFVNYAQALQIKHEIRKVIPLLYEDNIEIPANLAMFSRMRYNPHRTDLYWSKIADSMRIMRLNERVTAFTPTFQSAIAGSRRLPIRERNKPLGIEAKDNQSHRNKPLESSNASHCSKKHERKCRPTKNIRQTKTNAYHLKTSLQYLNKTETISLTSRSSNSSSSSSSVSKSFLKRLLCCSR